jgi:hypothetical protein
MTPHEIYATVGTIAALIPAYVNVVHTIRGNSNRHETYLEILTYLCYWRDSDNGGDAPTAYRLDPRVRVYASKQVQLLWGEFRVSESGEAADRLETRIIEELRRPWRDRQIRIAIFRSAFLIVFAVAVSVGAFYGTGKIIPWLPHSRPTAISQENSTKRDPIEAQVPSEGGTPTQSLGTNHPAKRPEATPTITTTLTPTSGTGKTQAPPITPTPSVTSTSTPTSAPPSCSACGPASVPTTLNSAPGSALTAVNDVLNLPQELITSLIPATTGASGASDASPSPGSAP